MAKWDVNEARYMGAYFSRSVFDEGQLRRIGCVQQLGTHKSIGPYTVHLRGPVPYRCTLSRRELVCCHVVSGAQVCVSTCVSWPRIRTGLRLFDMASRWRM